MVNPWHKYKKASKRKKQALHSLIAGLALFCFFYLITRFVSIPLCPINALFGVECPGCGMTRGFISIIRLDFKAAARHNLTSIPLFFGCCTYAVLCVTDILFKKNRLERVESFCKKPYMMVIFIVTYLTLLLANHLT